MNVDFRDLPIFGKDIVAFFKSAWDKLTGKSASDSPDLSYPGGSGGGTGTGTGM